MKTRLDFPAEPGHNELSLHWWHGSSKEICQKHGAKGNGNTLFIGTKGLIVADFNKHTVTMTDGSTGTPKC